MSINNVWDYEYLDARVYYPNFPVELGLGMIPLMSGVERILESSEFVVVIRCEIVWLLKAKTKVPCFPCGGDEIMIHGKYTNYVFMSFPHLLRL